MQNHLSICNPIVRSEEIVNRVENNDEYVLGDLEVTANLYCNFAYLYWEGCVICSIYLR